MLRRLLEKRVEALPDDCRAVFALRVLGELSVEETAAALGTSEVAVRMRYFLSRGLVRESPARDIGYMLEQVYPIDGARNDRIVARVLERIAAGT